jgi:hypothetical protein
MTTFDDLFYRREKGERMTTETPTAIEAANAPDAMSIEIADAILQQTTNLLRNLARQHNDALLAENADAGDAALRCYRAALADRDDTIARLQAMNERLADNAAVEHIELMQLRAALRGSSAGGEG